MPRVLSAGELIPSGTPTRCKSSEGYIRLHWNIASGRVWVYEHRVNDGRVVPADIQIHHINGIKDDNRKENLQTITRRAHGLLHCPLTFDVAEAAMLYRSGLCTREVGAALGVDGSNVVRQLRAAGITLRPIGHKRHPHLRQYRRTSDGRFIRTRGESIRRERQQRIAS